jgi:lipopolysaccharide/colanic/teichoic acid biosynthesis glycosyltransferase
MWHADCDRGGRDPERGSDATALAVRNGPLPPESAGECSPVVAGVRRALDCLIAAITLAVLSPLLLLIAIGIRLDSPGEVVFRQRRLGRDQKPFTLYKFRTMVPSGDQGAHRDYVARLIAADGTPHSLRNGTLFKPVLRGYVTTFGRRLRSWSLDEVPQLWNVLVGDMSLIGPRPVIPYEAAMYPPAWDLRFAVKPGLTGLWQVSGRNRLTYDEMIDLDLEYVRRRSLGLDAAILLKTIPTVVLRRGVS